MLADDASMRTSALRALAPAAALSAVVGLATALPASAGDVAAAGVPATHAGVLLDVVYAGWPTPLARAAARSGMTVVSGLDMLVHQAAEQFRLFTGREAPVAEMAAAGRAALERR